ncbi:MAG: hypothetical protein JST00_27965 [Deltaproteobacteria bacterium]|nr:hypothetical protein [Deltaproteobacteria bacterium]
MGALVVLGALHAEDSRADGEAPSPLRAAMQCDRATEPGRVRCTVEAHAEGGRTITWADVEIVAIPDFTTALKGRIGRDDTTFRDPTTSKWAFGLVAKKNGQGELRARVRAVVCPAAGDTRCAPVVVEVRAPVVVG